MKLSLYFALLSAILAAQALPADDFKLEVRYQVTGEVLSAENISAVAQVNQGRLLFIAGDEGREVQVLRRVAEDEYAVSHNLQLLPNGVGGEIDLEGLALAGDRLYAIGSHALVRPKLKPENTRALNRELLRGIDRQTFRDSVFELRLNKEGVLTAGVQVKSLRQRIAGDPLLGPFSLIPSKENGVDIEGLAAVGDKLFVGLRSPVLREGYASVLIFDFDKPLKADLVFLNLGGRGIRDLVRVSDGFLVIGGPASGDGAEKFRLFHWNGKDGIPGADAKVDAARSLGAIPLPDDNAKAEGITVLAETDSYYDALLVYDGVKNGGPTRYKIKK